MTVAARIGWSGGDCPYLAVDRVLDRILAGDKLFAGELKRARKWALRERNDEKEQTE